ncbi:MAG TPA: DEAD/DEAH box helicase [Planctomycetaceae bacterium]|nr:DEAD/DEAH box helicase [Planctomycetaceae bacterium]
MSLQNFHPIILQWFQSRFAGPTEPQVEGWPHISAGRDILIAAPTGSGKTLTAFLSAIDRLLRLAEAGELDDEIRIVYVSPLRALSNDMHRNLEQPLDEILALAAERGLEIPPIRVGLRTGDTTQSKRAAIVNRPPHILVTTPESLYLMLTSQRSREVLKTVETVIVDEIHALVRDKRGSHLSLTLERLAAICPRRLQRIGLSATQRPIEKIAEFLVGVSESRTSSDSMPVIIDIGHQRQLDLAIETPPSELGAVCMHEQWAEVNTRIVELINTHRATLIFVNTRRLAERLTHQLSEILGEDAISSHHGSLAYKHRQDTEQRLKAGQLKAVVATASLEMGIDVGYIDLVLQIGSPRNIATFLQRIGRSGHALGLVPKGRLFALTRDELIECAAMIRSIRQGHLDSIPIPIAPVDVLAQQIVAEVACQEWKIDELFTLCRRAAPYQNLDRTTFDRVVGILSEGLVPSNGRGRVFLHHDQVQRRLSARPGARMAAIANAGAIPDVFSIRVITEEDNVTVGTVDEHFGSETAAGDIFVLGNTSWRVRYLRGGDLFVSDAGGAPPSIPFWQGEAPGRTIELSEAVSQLREELEHRVEDRSTAQDWLVAEASVSPDAARQIVIYAAAQKAAIGLLPTCRRVVFERFFDESGGMQLVIHAPFGTRITRAWGLAMRKRFCRSFDFELQANADDDGIVLSLGPQHSFPLESMFPMLNARNVQEMFEQAVLAVPMFLNRWRWNATRALQIPRSRNGKKVPPALQRFRSEDLLTAVFPKLTGCQENVVGDIEIPDDPLVQQTMDDCLHEAHDMEALKEIFNAVARGEIEFIARDTREPSPFSYELLNANQYAFLDGGEAAERRARAVATRRSLSVDDVRDLGRLDAGTIAQVVADAQPLVRNADELHDTLLSRILFPVDEGIEWTTWFDKLIASGRATLVKYDGNRAAWSATERVPAVMAAFPNAVLSPKVEVPPGVRIDWEATDARLAMVRGLLEICGPVTTASAAARIGITVSQAHATLEALEGEGIVLRGRFSIEHYVSVAFRSAKDCEDAAFAERKVTIEPDAGSDNIEWCHRRLLARIHRLTMDGLRRQIEPVSVDVFMRFLFQLHGIDKGHGRDGANGLFEVIGQLQGMDIPSVAWERDILPLRLAGYQSNWLDELCLTGEVGWARLFPPPRNPDKSRPMASLTRVAPISIFLRKDLPWLSARAPVPEIEGLSSPATHVLELLTARGAMFGSDLQHETQMLRDHLDDALGELVSRGVITADGFSGLRSLVAEKQTSSRRPNRGRAERIRVTREAVGRWSIARRPNAVDETADSSQNAASVVAENPHAAAHSLDATSEWAWQLLRRWGVVFRDLLSNEDGTPPWFELLQVFRRLEARGEIRGGRFITGVAGEQFALADSVHRLRKLRDETPPQELVVISAADPLNLVGVLSRHSRVPRVASNRVAYLDGVPIAFNRGGSTEILQAAAEEHVTIALHRLRQASLLTTETEPPMVVVSES